MNEGTTRSIFCRVLLRAGVTCVLAGALIATSGCAKKRPAESERTPPSPPKQESSPAPSPPPPSPPPPSPPPAVPAAVERRGPATAAESLEGSGRVVWAKGVAGYFIAGMDGGLYEPYRAATIERVQQSLRDRGLYGGPINGILDTPTMKALFAFQQANHNLQLCGVPTPRTRKLLEQGSHTDVTS
jgi:putative peptidoglycan binding protein